MGRRQLNIYFCSVQNGQQNANGTLVVDSIDITDVFQDSDTAPSHIGTAWPACHDNKNSNFECDYLILGLQVILGVGIIALWHYVII